MMQKIIKQFPIVATAILLIGVSINMFLAPHQIAAGGVTGIGVLVESVVGVDRALVVLVLNAGMLVVTWLFLGKEYFIRTVIGSILLPISLAIVPEIMLTNDRLISVIFGSGIFATGVAMLYRISASSGGTTIPPLIFQKYFGLNTSVGLLATDSVIVIFNLFVFGVEQFFLAILSLIITSIVMTYIETGLKRKKAVMIMSETEIETIKVALLTNVTRGVTVFNVSGGYTGNEKNMLLIILSSHEYRAILDIIDTIDRNSFVIAYNVAEVHGLGFTYQPLG